MLNPVDQKPMKFGAASMWLFQKKGRFEKNKKSLFGFGATIQRNAIQEYLQYIIQPENTCTRILVKEEVQREQFKFPQKVWQNDLG